MSAPSRLTPQLLIQAYSDGYFPMPDTESNEILWFRPDPRAVFPLDAFHCSHSLKKTLSKEIFRVTFDHDFKAVMEGCADRKETWITDEFIDVYSKLHTLGYAHSVEVWNKNNTLVGGTYGVHIASAFFAESMFHRETNASKVALYFLVEKLRKSGFHLLETQFMTPHLKSLGAIEMSDVQYQKLLSKALKNKSKF